MCLILLAYKTHPDFPLIVAANRDEFYARPTKPAHFWADHPELLAGRDLQAGGTWMGIIRQGRFAAVTNVREPEQADSSLRSRGELTTDFLNTNTDAQKYLQTVHQKHKEYAGFNLLAGTLNELWFYSNRDHNISALTPGIYGISNGGFDEHWPKVARGKKLLTEALQQRAEPKQILTILQDRQIAEDFLLPDTGVGINIERWLSPLFIHSDVYGTRSSTVITLNNDEEVNFFEQSYNGQTTITNTTKKQFALVDSS